VRRINQIRCECQHLPPLKRWVEGEACADQMAQYDYSHTPHAAFNQIHPPFPCNGGFAQCEAPHWPSVSSTIEGALQGMWNEGPPPKGGYDHYSAMASTEWTEVACGFYSGPTGVTAVQNYGEVGF
jgi:hypothetical protein